MFGRLVFIVTGLLVCLAITGFAADNGVSSNPVKKEFRFDLKETERTNAVVKNLTHEIDLWQDAALKRNGKRMRAEEKRIFDIIEADIQARDRVIYRFENEAASSVTNVVDENGPAPEASVSDKHEARDDVKDLRKAKQLVKAKELLYDSIKRTDTFSNRYRLLGDYLEIVKRECRLNNVEMAEDGVQGKKDSFE